VYVSKLMMHHVLCPEEHETFLHFLH